MGGEAHVGLAVLAGPGFSGYFQAIRKFSVVGPFVAVVTKQQPIRGGQRWFQTRGPKVSRTWRPVAALV